MKCYYIFRMFVYFICACIWAVGILILFDAMLPESVTDEEQSIENRSHTNYYWKNGGNRNNKWMVVETNSLGRCNLKPFLKNMEWSIVVLGSEQNNHECRLPRCIHLDRYVTNGITRNAKMTSKKAMAYLYVIQMGATIIYDTTCNFKPLNTHGKFTYDGTSTGLVLDAERGSSMFNPYSHFGYKDVFPVGMPLNTSLHTDYHYTVARFRSPSIQHFMVAGQQGVTDSLGCAHVTFDEVIAPVVVPPGIFAFHHRVPTLFFKDSFWALLPPLALSVKNSLVVSLTMQRLVWEMGGFSSFVGSSIMADSSVGQCIAALSDSEQKAIDRLIVHLNDWQCIESFTFSQCILDLYHSLMQMDLITNNDADNMGAWLEELQWLGYELPARDITNIKFTKTTSVLYSSTWSFSRERSKYSLTNDSSQYTTGYNEILKFCGPFDLPWKSAQLTDVMLIITFNDASFYNNIIILDFIYRQYFQYIVVCGNKKEQFEELLHQYPQFTSFIYVEGLTEDWYFMYECTSLAMQMNFNVLGYLQIGDDTLINPWQIRTLQRDKIWIPKGLGLLDRQTTERRDTRWGNYMGKRAIDGVFQYLHVAASVNAHAKNFLQLYYQNMKREQFVYTRGCDFFYIPQRLKAEYVYLEGVFHIHASMVEIAIPVMVLGLDHVVNIQWVRDTSLWFGGEREMYDHIYDEFIYFIHPFKLAKYLKQERGRHLFCTKYLNFLKSL